MGEFLEFIRQEHIRVTGKKKDVMKRIKTADERLPNDSCSDITDLSQEDIMTTSKQLLSQKEREKLDRYNQTFKKVISNTVKKHNCFAEIPIEKRGRVNNSRYMIQMELRAKSEPKEFDEKSNSAHQFSVRNESIQADSEERAEIAMQTDIIDLKSINQQVDIYDLDRKRDASTQGPIQRKFLKETREIGIVTDFNKKFLVSQDWFFSQLYRDMLRDFFKKQGKQLPEGIAIRFRRHDTKGNYMNFDEAVKQKEDQTTQTQMENPQAEFDAPQLTVLSEPEIIY